MNEQLEAMLHFRLEEWARWVQGGAGMPGLSYPQTSPIFQDQIKSDRAPIPSCDREMEVERAVAVLASWDSLAADVLRAEYRAQPRFGDAHYEAPGNASEKTFRRLRIGRSTYFKKLDKARGCVWTAIAVKDIGWSGISA